MEPVIVIAVILFPLLLIALLVRRIVRRARDPERRKARLLKKVVALQTEIRILEEGLGVKEIFGPSVEDQMKAHKAKLLRAKARLAILEGDVGARGCPNPTCGHRNEPDARFCSRCGEAMT